MFRDGKEKRRDDAQERRERVDGEPAQGFCALSPVLQYHIYGVDAVGEIVREDRGGDYEAYSGRNFERETDADTV